MLENKQHNLSDAKLALLIIGVAQLGYFAGGGSIAGAGVVFISFALTLAVFAVSRRAWERSLGGVRE